MFLYQNRDCSGRLKDVCLNYYRKWSRGERNCQRIGPLKRKLGRTAHFFMIKRISHYLCAQYFLTYDAGFVINHLPQMKFLSIKWSGCRTARCPWSIVFPLVVFLIAVKDGRKDKVSEKIRKTSGASSLGCNTRGA